MTRLEAPRYSTLSLVVQLQKKQTTVATEFTLIRQGRHCSISTCVEVVERSGGRGVPEADASVCCAAARCKQAVLVRGPGDGLHRRCVVGELQHRVGGLLGPDVQLVVVPARGDLPVIRGPLQPAHLHEISHSSCLTDTSPRPASSCVETPSARIQSQ